MEGSEKALILRGVRDRSISLSINCISAGLFSRPRAEGVHRRSTEHDSDMAIMDVEF
jgi:hypothetical protein